MYVYCFVSTIVLYLEDILSAIKHGHLMWLVKVIQFRYDYRCVLFLRFNECLHRFIHDNISACICFDFCYIYIFYLCKLFILIFAIFIFFYLCKAFWLSCLWECHCLTWAFRGEHFKIRRFCILSPPRSFSNEGAGYVLSNWSTMRWIIHRSGTKFSLRKCFYGFFSSPPLLFSFSERCFGITVDLLSIFIIWV